MNTLKIMEEYLKSKLDFVRGKKVYKNLLQTPSREECEIVDCAFSVDEEMYLPLADDEDCYEF